MLFRSTAKTLIYMLESGAPLEKITFSSDGNGSMPRFNDKGVLIGLGVGSLKTTYAAVRCLVTEHDWSLEKALLPITTNVASTLLLTGKKGSIEIGADADIVVLDEDLNVSTVFARGRLMVNKGEVVVKGTFEK